MSFKKSILLIVSMLFCTFLDGAAQTAILNGENKIDPPRNEMFTNISGLIVSGRMKGTRPNGGSVDDNHPKSEIGTIYNKDGTIWHQFSNYVDSPIYIEINKRKDFIPFTSHRVNHYNKFSLRLIAESANWFEVEVNEETQETKYLFRHDHFFAKTDFTEWIKKGSLVKIDNKTTSVYVEPSSKEIEQKIEEKINNYWVNEVKGDWIYVKLEEKVENPQPIKGWIRWRDGRKILVGWILNDFKIPQAK